MNPLSCAEVEEHLELFAAQECDADTRTAVGAHLEDCPSCARATAETSHLLALLTLRAREEDQLARLRRALADRAPARRPVAKRLVLRRVGALAAMLLLTFGLSVLPHPGSPPKARSGDVELALAVNPSPARQEQFLKSFPAGAARAIVKAAEPPPAAWEKQAILSIRLDLGGKTAAAFRAAIAKGQRPLPPALPLQLRLRNDGPGNLTVWAGGKDFGVRWTIRGPGVVSAPVPDEVWRLAKSVSPIVAKPNQEIVVPIDRLVSHSGGRAWFHYWTTPGEYTVSALVTIRAVRGSGRPRLLTLDSGSVKIRVTAPR